MFPEAKVNYAVLCCRILFTELYTIFTDIDAKYQIHLPILSNNAYICTDKYQYTLEMITLNRIKWQGK